MLFRRHVWSLARVPTFVPLLLLVLRAIVMAALYNGRPLGENDPSGLSEDHTWLGSVHLALGGSGAVHYWLKVDKN